MSNKNPYPLFTLVYVRITSIFLLLYIFSNEFNTDRSYYFHLFFPFEEDLPFFGWAVYPYLSVFIFFVLPFFYSNQDEIKKLEKTILFSILVSFLIFLIFPTKLGFKSTPETSVSLLYDSLKKLDRPHNLVPSLHICLSTIIFIFLHDKETQKLLRAFFTFWFLIICVSVVCIHQHHILDVITGSILAFVSSKIFDK